MGAALSLALAHHVAACPVIKAWLSCTCQARLFPVSFALCLFAVPFCTLSLHYNMLCVRCYSIKNMREYLIVVCFHRKGLGSVCSRCPLICKDLKYRFVVVSIERDLAAYAHFFMSGNRCLLYPFLRCPLMYKDPEYFIVVVSIGRDLAAYAIAVPSLTYLFVSF